MTNTTFLKLTWQHLLRHWQLNLIVLATLLLGSALLAAMPMVTAVIAGESFNQALDNAPLSGRNLLVESDSFTNHLNDGHEATVEAEIGPFIREIIDIRDAILTAESAIYRNDGTEEKLDEFLRLRFWAFSSLADHAELVAGQWPAATPQTADNGQMLVEATVGTVAADLMALSIGDEFSVDSQTEPLGSENGRFRIRIVGILSPHNPNDDFWWGDLDLRPFGLLREPFTNSTERINLSVFVPTELIVREMPQHRNYWRIFLDRQAITIGSAPTLRDQLINLNLKLGAQATTPSSGLPNLIDAFEADRAEAQVSLLLLTAQSLLAVLYTLGLISTFLLDRSRAELATMAGRGFSSGQLTRIFALETAVLAFGIALPLGPVLAFFGFQLWSRVTATPVLTSIPTISWGLGATAVFTGWIAFVVPLYFATRSQLIDWLRQRTRPPQRLRWRQTIFDLFLLTIGGLAYWQLRQTGTAVLQDGGATIADPILLLGPTLLLLAVGLLLLRLFPFIIQAIGLTSRWAASFVLPTALTRLARDTIVPSQITLLIGLSAGLTFFAAVFGFSIDQRQVDTARYNVGADIVLRQPRPIELAQADTNRVDAMQGVTAVSSLYRGFARPEFRTAFTLNLLAVNPDTFPDVARFPSGVSQFSVDTLANVLQPLPEENGRLPMIISRNTGPRSAQVGDLITFKIGPDPIEFEITGIISSFPTLPPPFMVTNLTELEKRVNLNSALLRVEGERELWLATSSAHHAALTNHFQQQTNDEVGLASYQAQRLVGDRQTQLQRFRANPISRLTTTAFTMNAVILVVLGSMAFLFVQILAARRRLLEFTVLRAIGLSQRQFISLLSVEGIIVLGLGLLAGLGIGLTLATLMRSFLSLTLTASLGGQAIDQIIINWLLILLLFGLLILLYGVGLALVVFIVGRNPLHRTLRLGEE